MIVTREQVERWLDGCVKAIVQGGALSVKAWLALAAASVVGMHVPVLNWEAAGAVFVYGAVDHLVDFLKVTPAPSEIIPKGTQINEPHEP